MKTLYLDLETYSETSIRAGLYRYAECVSTEILLFAYALDDAPAVVWDLTTDDLMPDDLAAAMVNPAVEVVAHNAEFDRTILNYRTNGLRMADARWRCTMAQALAHSLPGALASLCDVLRVDAAHAKDKAGRDLVNLFCKPRPATSKIPRATRQTHPDKWAQFKEYARLDVEAMRAIDRKMPRWNATPTELALWRLDQEINGYGFLVDVDLARSAVEAVDKAQADLADRTSALTDGAVGAATQRDALLAHLLAQYGVDLPDMQSATLERRMADPDLPAPVRELIGIRLQASTSSTAKYKTLMAATSRDSRLRGTLQYCGASRTGRWTGKTFQPQNLPRPTLKQADIDAGIAALKAGCADIVVEDVMALTSSAIRGVIIAPEGERLVVSDLSNIEGRVQSWLAGEDWKLDAFRAFDAGTGHDLYKLAYAKSFGIRPEAVTKDQRQIGKVQELALGYEGGVGAFVTFATAYGISLETMADQAAASIPRKVWDAASGSLEYAKQQKRDTYGLSDAAWLVCESFKRSWRMAHPNIAAFWGDLQNAVKSVLSGGAPRRVGQHITVDKVSAWLRLRLPSGRYLCYPSARVEDDSITYMGVNQYTRKWSRLTTYGGKLFENICQAVARDVLAYNLPRIQAAGYIVVLTVHDEVICEHPASHCPQQALDRLSGLLATPPVWAPDMPLAAGGFTCDRYRKD